MTNHSSAPPVAEIITLAVGLHQSGHLDEAEELYQRVLEIAPDHADALHFLGVLHHQQGDSQSALRLIRKALQRDPQYLGARINLGNVLKEQGRFIDAEAEYRKVIQSGAESADAYNNLGAVLRLQKRLDEAITAYERATELAPGNADAFQNLGNALKAANRIEEALTAYRKAIEIDPGHCDAHLNLGRALYRFGRLDEALTVYRKWLEVEPDNPIAAHMLAACQGDQSPTRCSDEFVKQSFDAFAVSFDEVLERLEYRAPRLVGEAVESAAPKPARQFCVLDAGCGTGLCGPGLRPFANHLVGVDLSPKMVDKARGGGLYDDLIVAELTEHMRQHEQRYDLIISADTLVYFGDLGPVFQAAAGALKPGGILVFTLERADEDLGPTGYQLNPHGRYSHSRDFVETAMRATGFTIRELRCDTLRLEVHQPVDGLIVTACKQP
jgi:predicted TPR repeat methyltransferase